MAEAIVLIPKRKVSGFMGSPSSEDIASIVNHVITTVSVPGAPISGETVAYWHVTKEMKIPVGTDMYR